MSHAELSYLEKRVLLALKELEKGTPQEIMTEGNFRDLVEVMNASSWLQAKKLVKITDSLKTYYRLDEDGKKYVKSGMPERRILELLRANQGKMTMEHLFNSGLTKKEIGIGLGYLREGGVELKNGAISAEPEVINNLNAVIMKREAALLGIAEKREVEECEVEVETLKHIKGRKNVVRKREKVLKDVELTEDGKKLIEQGIELKEEIAQITPELLLDEKWKKSELRKYDIHMFAPQVHGGKEHPLTQIIQEVREIFLSMGFKEIEYDYIQPCFWNFDALFCPQDHPARDLQDTFYMKNPARIEIEDEEGWILRRVKKAHETGIAGSEGWKYRWRRKEAERTVLRTHTTVNTIRYLAQHPEPPVKVFTVGRVFRNEAINYKNLPEFVQIEGILMEKGANFAMLVGLLKEFYRKMGFPDIHIQPNYFPYTEPSLQVIAKHKDMWLELGGAGMFRPEVLAPLGVKHPVLAWGLGLERLAMLRYNLQDIRELYISDIGWLRKRKV